MGASVTYGSETAYTGSFSPGSDLTYFESNELYQLLGYTALFDRVAPGDQEILNAVNAQTDDIIQKVTMQPVQMVPALMQKVIMED